MWYHFLPLYGDFPGSDDLEFGFRDCYALWIKTRKKVYIIALQKMPNFEYCDYALNSSHFLLKTRKNVKIRLIELVFMLTNETIF
jgi:hypothetical protein